MKIIHRVAAIAIAFGIASGAAQAQSVDQRHYNQDRRIDQGVRNGSLTPSEAHRVEHQEHAIDRQENRMRYRDGGHLSGHDRAVLERHQYRVSRHIYRAKHNRNYR